MAVSTHRRRDSSCASADSVERLQFGARRAVLGDEAPGPTSQPEPFRFDALPTRGQNDRMFAPTRRRPTVDANTREAEIATEQEPAHVREERTGRGLLGKLVVAVLVHVQKARRHELRVTLVEQLGGLLT